MNLQELEQKVWQRLTTVMDPELHIDLVSLGLIYEVSVSKKSNELSVFILLTLTTPGCPLISMFEPMILDALEGIPNFDPKRQVQIELTFDPPWTPDMMSAEAKAELDIVL